MKEIGMSIRQFAKEIGVNEKSVRKAISEGKIKKGFDHNSKKIIRSIAMKEYGELKKIIRPQAGISKAKVAEKLEKRSADEKKEVKSALSDPNPEMLEFEDLSYEELIKQINIHPNLPYNETLRLREILGIAMDRIKLEELRGSLVRKSDVDKSLYAFGDQLKKNLFNIPTRVIDDIRSAPNKVEAINILTHEIQQTLSACTQINEPANEA